jgi:hypothetical protein
MNQWAFAPVSFQKDAPGIVSDGPMNEGKFGWPGGSLDWRLVAIQLGATYRDLMDVLSTRRKATKVESLGFLGPLSLQNLFIISVSDIGQGGPASCVPPA